MARTGQAKHIDAVKLLDDNLRCYQMILRLAEEARDEIQSGNGHGLAQKLAKRQHIQEKITARNRIIEEARQQLANTPLDEKITDLVRRSATIIAEIQEVDRKTFNLIQGERDGLRAGLARFRHAKKACRGYGNKSLHVPRFIDRQK